MAEYLDYAEYDDFVTLLWDEEAVVMPLTYSSTAYFALLKPWARAYKRNALNHYSLKDIVIEETVEPALKREITEDSEGSNPQNVCKR